MKKKFLAMYALAGALVASPVFTSCVDDTESASVTAIRNAKAEQLKAMAELDKAKAAYKLADAAYKQAETEYKANQTAEAKAKFVYEIEEIKAKYESAIMQHNMMKAEWLKKLKAEENSILTTAVTNYTTALSNLNTNQNSLLSKKMEFTKLQIDSASLAVKVDNYIAGQNKTIEDATAQIELLKAYDGETLEALQEKMAELVAEYNDLSVEQSLAEEAENAAEEAIKDVEGAIAETAYVKAMGEIEGYSYPVTTTTTNDDGSTSTTTTPENISIEVEKTEYIVPVDPAKKVVTSYTIKESEILKAKKVLNDALASAKETLGTPKAGETPASGLYIELEEKETALKEAQDALAALTAEATAKDKADAEDAVEKAQIALAEYKDETLQPGLKAVTDAEEAIAEFEALLVTVAEGSDAHKEWVAAIAEFEAAVETWNTADAKVTELGEAIKANGVALKTNDGEEELDENNLQGECKLLYLMSQNAINPASEIATLEEYIATAKANIEKAKATFTAEDFEAILLAEIEALEAEIAIEEALVAKYKAEVEALLATEEA